MKETKGLGKGHKGEGPGFTFLFFFFFSSDTKIPAQSVSVDLRTSSPEGKVN